MTTPIVTREEFLQWIMEQPDEKSLDWRGRLTTDSCRCPMAEYSYQKYPSILAIACYVTTQLAGTEDVLWKFEKGFYFSTFYNVSSESYNYGQLKAALKQKGLV